MTIAFETLAEIPRVLARHHGSKEVLVRRCRAERPVNWSTSEFVEQVRRLSAGLDVFGIARGDRVAIMSESRPEWLMCDLAILSLGAVTVPIFPTLAAPQARYVLEDSEARLAIVSDQVQVAKLQEIRHLVPSLAFVVIIDRGTDAQGQTRGQTRAASGSVLTFAELAARGRERLIADPSLAKRLDEEIDKTAPADLATIIYTSGTTGEPKGVMLTHHNIVSNVIASRKVLALSPADVALTFLPLSHSFERTVVYLYLVVGLTVVFAENIDTLARDLPATRPTLMTGVPRVFEKLHARIVDTARQGAAFRRRLFDWAVKGGLRRVHRAQTRKGGLPRPSGLGERVADALVFKKIRARTGGKLRLMVSGSAPLSREVAEFFAAAGLLIVEGYGLTETSPVLAVNRPDAPRFGTVGQAIDGVELRIAEDGEILARGPNIMKGYWKKPEATAAVIADGWFHTGDVGEISADGYLAITDRKKDLLVTSGGKKVAPQPIEARLTSNGLVAEAVLFGDRRRFPAVLILPNYATLEQRLRALGRPAGSREELVTRPDVLALYQEIVDALNRDLAQFEQIKRLALLPSEFSIAGGELTPTLKVRRKVIEERWKDVIDALYAPRA